MPNLYETMVFVLRRAKLS